MQEVVNFILANQLLFVSGGIGFLLGASLFGGWTYWLARRRLQWASQDYNALQAQMYRAREELANLKGQHGQMQHQLSEQTNLLKEARLQLGQEFLWLLA